MSSAYIRCMSWFSIDMPCVPISPVVAISAALTPSANTTLNLTP
ncbi:UNVERIFIED_ORG: hypothetical protein ABIC62_006313 [Burkholderia sp. 1595]|uniref:Uncharacterized protein n=1 Tax=Paraburkholderia terricola TaxID=169427 RepID=A0ABU1M1J1_9BURK|nr:hypothetical protein [Paraburkholderia terricola]